MKLSPRQRRKLNAYLYRNVRCPKCREQHLKWASREAAVLCLVCGNVFSLKQLRLIWNNDGYFSFWLRQPA